MHAYLQKHDVKMSNSFIYLVTVIRGGSLRAQILGHIRASKLL